MTPDRNALPKYIQLSETLLREIAAGRLRVGDRLPPERAMAGTMGVAVGTLRKALARLQKQGVVARQHGSGNYICGTGQNAGVYSFFRLERMDGGGLPRARLLGADRIATPAQCTGFGPFAHRITRLRLLDTVVVAAEEIWLDAGYAERLDAAKLSESLYLFYREQLGLWISGVEDRIGVGAVPDWAGEIGLAPGTPCGLVERASTTPEGSCPEHSRTWFNPARARYVARSQ